MSCASVATALLATALLAPGIARGEPDAPSAAQAGSPGDDAAGRRAAERLGLWVGEGERIEITANELVVSDPGDGERIEFEGDVKVVQGTMTIHSDKLVATYPEGAGGHPSRIVASGSVRIIQEGVEVRCTDAVYDDRAGRITCSSDSPPAELKRGDDIVTGREIEFDLRAGILKVRGRAKVRIEPRTQSGAKRAGDSTQ